MKEDRRNRKMIKRKWGKGMRLKGRKTVIKGKKGGKKEEIAGVEEREEKQELIGKGEEARDEDGNSRKKKERGKKGSR